MVCNFSKPTENKPCLLEHEDTVLVFHELGHAIHDLVAHTKYAVFHGASCADFVSMPTSHKITVRSEYSRASGILAISDLSGTMFASISASKRPDNHCSIAWTRELQLN